MGEVFEWIKSIIFIIIMSSFIQMIMPDGSYKKYIRLVFGIIMIAIIIKPISAFLDNEDLFQKTYYETSHIIDKSNILDNSELISDKQTELTIKTYKKRIENEIRHKISSIVPDRDSDIEIEMDENIKSSGFGSIRKIYIVLDEKKSDIVNIEDVKRVDIDIGGKNEKEVNVTHLNSIEKEEDIKETLNMIFGIPQENIIINSKEKENKG